MRLRPVWLCLVLAAVMAAPAPVLAQKKRPTPQEQKRALGHYEQAQRHYERAEYDDAVREYLAAYEVVAEPELLYNVGQAYRLKGDREQAVAYYRRYLTDEPDGRAATEARELIAGLERELAAEAAAREQAAQEQAARDQAAADQAAADQAAADQAARDQAARDQAARDAVERGRARPGRNLRLAGLVTAGAGVIALGLGVKFGLDARSASSRISDATMWSPELDEDLVDGDRAERNMFIALGVGTAAVATGGVLYLLGRRAGHAEAGATVAPLAGDDRVGLALSGRF